MTKISTLRAARKRKGEGEGRQSSQELRAELIEQATGLADFAVSSGSREITFKDFEEALTPKVFALARTVIVLFLVACEEQLVAGTPERMEKGGRRFRRAAPEARNLNTWFGVVRYWRTYMREVTASKQRGFHPLDAALGLTADKMSVGLLAVAVRLATKLSFAEARGVLQWFLPSPPSVEVIEHATLGFGRHTAEWFRDAPPPERDGEDGEVLLMMADSKGVPTATEQELKLRRGKRRKRKRAASPRHRGRDKRGRRTRKPRRKKGDKSKNARMATVVVMYTLKRKGKKLLGPINRWVYASFAPKKHVFEIARREADKRGFTLHSGRLVQVMTDGDEDLARYTADYFPDAIHSIDVMHVTEKLYEAAACLYREGDDALHIWAEEQKDRLYAGKVNEILSELRSRLFATPKTGPGNKGKRERLEKTIRYIDKRAHQMRYDELIERDLEIGSGMVEGLVKSIVGKRCDHGGMRWIPERVEPLLQLRCIDANGDWDRFVQFVHDKTRSKSLTDGERIRLQQRECVPLPEVAKAA